MTRALLDGGVKSILYSYFFIECMNRTAFVDKMQREYPHVRWFLDSGAFSYYTRWATRPGSLPPPEQYFMRYCQYIDAYGSKYCRIAELDLDNSPADLEGCPSIGEVDDWREQLLTTWPELPITPVWHPIRGMDAWKKYLADPRIKFVGLGGGTAQQSIGYQRRLVMSAHQAGKRVHGFAMTKIQTVLKEVPYDTVDSTSWVMGQKFGTLYVYRHNKFFQLGKDQGKDRRLLFKSYFKAIGVDVGLIDDSDKNMARVAKFRKKEVDAVVKMYAMRPRHPMILTPEQAAKKLAIAEVRKANVKAWVMLAERLETVQKRREARSEGYIGLARQTGTPENQPEERLGAFAAMMGTRLLERDGSPAKYTSLEYGAQPRDVLKERPDLPRPAVLECPNCGERHIDQDEWVTRPHHTHLCLFCGKRWRLEEYMYGVPPAREPKGRIVTLPEQTGRTPVTTKLRERTGEFADTALARMDDPSGRVPTLPDRDGGPVTTTVKPRERTGTEPVRVAPTTDREAGPTTKGRER